MNIWMTIAAHVLIGLYFISYGIWNIYHWAPIIEVMAQKKIPHPYMILPVGILVQAVAGGMIMFNMYTKIAAWVLIPFTVVAVFVFHPFWRYQGEHKRENFSIFLANVTVVLGALFLLLSI